MALPHVFRRATIGVLVVLGVVGLAVPAAGRRAVTVADDRDEPAALLTAAAVPATPAEATVAPVAPRSLPATLAAVSAEERPAALLRWATLSADPEPALAFLDDHDERLRMAAIIALRRLHERPVVAEALERMRAREPDPRVRQAIAAGTGLDQIPEWVRQTPRITLPTATALAPARSVDVMWDPESGGGAPINRTTIDIDPEGRATVDTRSDDGQKWHVRYAAWAWRDAQGNLVIDARDQAVEQVSTPPGWGPDSWSPDSFIVSPDGQCRTVDDRESRRTGAAAVPGAG